MIEADQLHLVINGKGTDANKLKDVKLIYKFLDEYPSVIGMTKIIKPQVYTYNGQKPQDWGVSGFVLIAESHISIHTFPSKCYANIDIFSCKNFDARPSLTHIEDTFSLTKIEMWTLERGDEYLTSAEAYQGIQKERANLIPTLEPQYDE